MPGGGNPAKSRILAPLHGAGLGQVPASELSCAKGTEVALYHPGLLSPAGVLGGAPTRLLGWGVGCSMAGSLCSSSAFQSVVWTNACRQSQEFRPLTSASSAQGTARETAGRGWGGRRGEHQPAATPGLLLKFHFLSVGSLPGPARAFPG